jgi:UDP-glucose 4-epimerase
VTGATGLLGSHLLPLLHARSQAQIIATVRDATAPAWLSKLGRVRVIVGDLRDSATWRRSPSTVTRVFHLAAAIERDRESGHRTELARDNLTPTAHLVECCRSWPRLRQVIYSSSVSVYGHTTATLTESSATAPHGPYAAAKLAGEDLLHTANLPEVSVSCLRYTSLYGPGMYPDTVLPIMIRQALSAGEIVVYGQGRRTQDFLHCHDAANANLLAYRRGASGIFNIGSGVSVSMAELARTVSEVFTDGGAHVNFATDQAEGSPGYSIDIAKACHELDYRPHFQLEAGLRQMKTALGDLQPCVQSPCS